MSDCSDTESESSLSDKGWDAADFMQLAAELGRIGETPATLEVPDALDALHSLDICAVEHDEQLHETIQHVSNALISFLDSIVLPHERHMEEVQANLLALLDESCMALLLQYRVLFRAIASRSMVESSSSIPVCWVDVVLAQLGNAVVQAAGMFYGVQPSEQNQPDALRAQRADDMLRAAVQLPETWADIQHVLSSEYASPAATRLAFSLVWGMTVMAHQLAEDDSLVPYHVKDGLFRVLQQHLKQRNTRRAHNMDVDVDEHERVTYAMLVSLYAFADTTGTSVAESPCRPQTHATLLEMIDIVLQPERTLLASCSIHPAVNLDTPRAIILKWGRTLPWSWRVWRDSRLYQSELVEHLTASWLHHLDVSAADISIGHSVEWWDDQLVDALECDPPSALSMMSRLLLAILTSKDSAAALRENATMDVVLKICWSVKHMLQAMPLDDAALSTLYGIMYQLSLRLGHQELDLAVKDLIVEVLSLSLENVRLALASLCDPKSECPLKWERKLSDYIKSANKSCRDDISVLELRSMRQALQVLALAWRADCTPFPASETMSRRFLSVLLGWLESESLESLVWTMLGDATIGALAVSSRSATALADYCWANLIWGLFQDADPADLPMAASLAAYMIAIVQVSPVEGLVCAEAWDYFRDVMLLILNRDFGGADEPLALLVCPAICRVLVALVRNAPPATVRYYSASPWTGCMVMHMKSVKEEDEQNDEYTNMLRELIGPFAGVLFLSLEERARKTSRKTRSMATVTDQLKNLDDLEFTFCWSQGQACLVPS